MPSTVLSITTDDDGRFSESQIVNPPGFWKMKVKLVVTLLTPEDTTVIGTFDVDSVTGDPSNQAKGFTVETGEQYHLGTWKLSGGDNLVKVEGRTEPKRPNTTVEVNLEVSL